MRIARTVISTIAALCGAMTIAAAQTIVLQDGGVVPAKGLRRLGDTIMAVISLPTDSSQAGATGEVGYPLSQIVRLELPEPPQFKIATDLALTGKAEKALTELEPVVKFYEGLRDAPGSYWIDSELLKMQLLASLGHYDEASAVGDRMARSTTDPEAGRAARIFSAAAQARKDGDAAAKAADAQQDALDHGTRPALLAAAALELGETQLQRKEWDPALLAFLELSVFYPQQSLSMPRALLGAGQAYVGMADYARAKAALNDLISRFDASPEAGRARTELTRIAKLENNRTAVN